MIVAKKLHNIAPLPLMLLLELLNILEEEIS